MTTTTDNKSYHSNPNVNSILTTFADMKKMFNLGDEHQIILTNPNDAVSVHKLPKNFEKENIAHLTEDGFKRIIFSIEDYSKIDKTISDMYERDSKSIIEKNKAYAYSTDITGQELKDKTSKVAVLMDMSNLDVKKMDYDKFLTFITAHELGHAYFKSNDIKLDKDKFSEEDIKNVSSLIQSFNKGSNELTNNMGGNLQINRDEIHSDIFALHYFFTKYDKNDINTQSFLKDLQELRFLKNYASDVNGRSDHNTELVFSSKNQNEIYKLAKSDLSIDEKLNKINDITDNIFIETLQKYGLTIKTNVDSTKIFQISSQDAYVNATEENTAKIQHYEKLLKENNYNLDYSLMHNGVIKNNIKPTEEFDGLNKFVNVYNIQLQATDSTGENITDVHNKENEFSKPSLK